MTAAGKCAEIRRSQSAATKNGNQKPLLIQGRVALLRLSTSNKSAGAILFSTVA
jgi:hypothetical protein